MDNSPSFYIIIGAALFALLGLSLFFSICETGFSALSRTKLKNMARKKKYRKSALLALKLLDAYDKLLSSILIGNTIANVASSALATMFFFMLFGPKGVSLATVILTVVILVFCEISPKTLSKESPELAAMWATPLMRIIVFIFTPLNYLASAWKKLIVKIFPPRADRSVTDEELITIVEEMRQEGGINRHEEQMIRHAIEFDDITAAEIVTPRVDLAAVPQDSTAAEIDRVFAETGFSRLPVYNDNIDNITGMIMLKDFHHEVIKKGRPPSEIIKPVVFVTKTIKISKLLRTLQEKKSHMAVLVDEFGGTLGIATIEDILEELVGEIWDEHDKVAEPFRQADGGGFTVLGSANLQDMFDYINSKTAGDTKESFDNSQTGGLTEEAELPNTTVGNWVLENMGRMPRAGEQFDWGNLRIKITRVHHHRVMEVEVNEPASGCS